MVIMQARPVPKQSDNEGERKENENEEEKDEDISVPGSSYVKLVPFTPQPVLPGNTNTFKNSYYPCYMVSNLRNRILCLLLLSNVHVITSHKRIYFFIMGK